MEKLRVVSLSERMYSSREACVGLELAPETRQLTVGEVFEALQTYLDANRAELCRRGPDSVRVSLVRSAAAITGAPGAWTAALH